MKPEELIDIVTSARAFEPVTVPRTSKRGRMRLLSRGENRQVKIDARAALAEIGATGPTVNGYVEWHEEVATRTLAIAIRNYENPELALAPLEYWEACDDNQINTLFMHYQDMDRRLDPLASSEIGADEIVAIDAAIKKKSLTLLLSYGSQKLASFLLTSAGQPES